MELSATLKDRLADRRHSRSGQPEPSLFQERDLVLVIDDEPEITASVKELLSGEYDVVTANTPEEALAVLGAEEVSVVLSDQRMPV
jgi:response regulator RpfG family c-di-GMP phosphodiesterase